MRLLSFFTLWSLRILTCFPRDFLDERSTLSPLDIHDQLPPFFMGFTMSFFHLPCAFCMEFAVSWLISSWSFRVRGVFFMGFIMALTDNGLLFLVGFLTSGLLFSWCSRPVACFIGVCLLRWRLRPTTSLVTEFTTVACLLLAFMIGGLLLNGVYYQALSLRHLRPWRILSATLTTERFSHGVYYLRLAFLVDFATKGLLIDGVYDQRPPLCAFYFSATFATISFRSCALSNRQLLF